MKSLKELCENIIYKKCSEPVNCGCSWLNCGFQCIAVKLYQELETKLFWYCECKKKNLQLQIIEETSHIQNFLIQKFVFIAGLHF